MDECIKRQDAIDAIKSTPTGNWSSKRYAGEIEKIPPADVKPVVRGKWIYTPTEPLGYVCSVCQNGCCRFDFCPYCGSYNGGDAE